MAKRLAVLCAMLTCMSLVAQIHDDFSGGDWKLFSSTPGTISAEKGRLHLKDSAEPPNWITASKVFEIDADRTPWFVVKVADVSDGGTVKLIRREPYDKRVALDIDGPGVYAIDVRKEYGWKGSIAVETCLYATGDEEEITYAYVKYAAAPTEEEAKAIAERKAGGNVRLQVGEFDVVPLFHSCGFYFRSPGRPGLSAKYRRQGGEWQDAFPPAHVPEDGMYRGSIVRLEEDTPYELRIVDGDGTVLGEKPFRTWRSDVPVAKTIVLDETNFSGNLRVAESGTPDGWIRITAREGFVLRNGRGKPLIELYKRRYVLLEGLTLRGGAKEAISIRKCEHVRVVNCDVAGWGRTGTQRFDKGGVYYTEGGAGINWDTAILVSRSLGTVIERCYVHDPVSRANSWYYSHPAGPQAAGMDKPRSTVVRYNDFVGSDPHRWNDAIEGAGNFESDGGFNRDADIHGNLMCFANDDAIEIDGGQINVRVFANKFEGCLCGTSIQGCMAGPSYVFDNLMVNMGDERGLAGQTIKTSSRVGAPSAVSFLFGNTCHGPSRDLGLLAILRVVAKNNIFAGSQAITGRDRSPQSECDYNLFSTGQAGDEPNGILGRPDFVDAAGGDFSLRAGSPGIGQGVALPNFSRVRDGRVDLGAVPFGSGLQFPVRPLPVRTDRQQLMFSSSANRRGDAQTVRVSATEAGFSGSYRIARNEVFDWFTVSPGGGGADGRGADHPLGAPGSGADAGPEVLPGCLSRAVLGRPVPSGHGLCRDGLRAADEARPRHGVGELPRGRDAQRRQGLRDGRRSGRVGRRVRASGRAVRQGSGRIPLHGAEGGHVLPRAADEVGRAGGGARLGVARHRGGEARALPVARERVLDLAPGRAEQADVADLPPAAQAEGGRVPRPAGAARVDPSRSAGPDRRSGGLRVARRREAEFGAFVPPQRSGAVFGRK